MPILELNCELASWKKTRHGQRVRASRPTISSTASFVEPGDDQLDESVAVVLSHEHVSVACVGWIVEETEGDVCADGGEPICGRGVVGLGVIRVAVSGEDEHGFADEASSISDAQLPSVHILSLGEQPGGDGN